MSGAAELSREERFTQQRRVDDGAGTPARELYDYGDPGGGGGVRAGGRPYLPDVGVFAQPDTIVPDPTNPQALNRYAYALNNPLKYADSSGHWPEDPDVLRMAGALGRQLASLGDPARDRAQRDAIGGALVLDIAPAIAREATARGVDPSLVGAVLRHDAGAAERRVVGPFADAAEVLALVFKPDESIGPAQMTLGTAQELEQLGDVPAQANTARRVAALLDRNGSVAYAAGMLQYITDQLRTVPEFSNLAPEEQTRLVAIGYNRGWANLRSAIAVVGVRESSSQFDYDEKTIDEYKRWSASNAAAP